MTQHVDEVARAIERAEQNEKPDYPCLARAAMRAVVKQMYEKLSIRLSNHLIETRPGFDDSITGLNDAWDIMRNCFDAYMKEAGIDE